VQLRHSWYGGVTALVLLPSALTIPSTDHERLLPGRSEMLPPAEPAETPATMPRHAAQRNAQQPSPMFEPQTGPVFDPYSDGDEHGPIAGR
jgi:hypothetical protein